MSLDAHVVPCPSCGLPIHLPAPRFRHAVAVFNCACGKRWLAEIIGLFDATADARAPVTWELGRELAEVG